MAKDFLNAKIFDSRIKSDNITKKERLYGYLLGPFSVMMLNSILNNYLNVYYTDVMNIGHVWGGWFLSLFPIVVKALDAFTFIIMGVIIDRFYSRQGKARPWILFSAPLLNVALFIATLLFKHNILVCVCTLARLSASIIFIICITSNNISFLHFHYKQP